MKAGYGIGDFGIQLAINTTALYHLYFYTDIFMIGSTMAGVILLVSKIVQTLFNPFIGIISDSTKTRWGKKLPYLIFGAIPFGVSLFLIFASPKLYDDAKTAYAFFTSIFFFIMVSFINIPYSSLTAAMTKSSEERSQITGYRMVFAIIGTLVAAGATKPLISLFRNEIDGFRFVSGLYCLLIIIVMAVVFFIVKENEIIIEEEKKHSIRENIKIILSNRPFIFLSIASFMVTIAVNILAAVVNYYFKYIVKAESMIPFAFLAIFLTSALSIPVYVKISNMKSKKIAFNVGLVVLSTTLISFYFIRTESLIITIIQFIAVGIGLATVFLCPWSMIPDTIEYSELKTGYRKEGLYYGCFMIFFSVGAALAGLFTGIGLEISGYIPNVDQTTSALHGIRMLLSLVPALFIIIGIAVLLLYPIDHHMHKKIIHEIAKNNKR